MGQDRIPHPVHLVGGVVLDELTSEPPQQVDSCECDSEARFSCHHITVVDASVDDVALVRVGRHLQPIVDVVPQVGSVQEHQLV